MSTSQTSARQVLGTIAPKLAELTEKVLFDDIWERPELSPRERSLVTVAALISLYRLEQLPFHLQRAIDNGISRDELAELATHLAFYAGWPAAVSAVGLLSELPEPGPDTRLA